MSTSHHPYIMFLIRNLEHIHETLDGDPGGSLLRLRRTLRTMGPRAKTQEEKIYKEITAKLENILDKRAGLQDSQDDHETLRTKLEEFDYYYLGDYEKIIESVWFLSWKVRYFFNESYRPEAKREPFLDTLKTDGT